MKWRRRRHQRHRRHVRRWFSTAFPSNDHAHDAIAALNDGVDRDVFVRDKNGGRYVYRSGRRWAS